MVIRKVERSDDDLYDTYANAYDVALHRGDEDEHAWPKRAVYELGRADGAAAVLDWIEGQVGNFPDVMMAVEWARDEFVPAPTRSSEGSSDG